MMIDGQLLFLYFKSSDTSQTLVKSDIWKSAEECGDMLRQAGTWKVIQEGGICTPAHQRKKMSEVPPLVRVKDYKPIEKRKYAEPVESMEAWQDQTVGAKGPGVGTNGAAPDDSSTKWPGHISETRNEQRWMFLGAFGAQKQTQMNKNVFKNIQRSTLHNSYWWEGCSQNQDRAEVPNSFL